MKKLGIALSIFIFFLAAPNAFAAKCFQKDTNGTLTTSLVSYYQLEDATDFFGPNNLTNNSTAPFVAGKVNNAVSLNGTSQYLSTSSAISTVTSGFSVAGWVNVTSTSLSAPTIENGSSGGNEGYVVGIGGTNPVNSAGNNIAVCAWGVACGAVSGAVGTGWHFVVVTVSSTSNIWHGYVDGVLSATTLTATPLSPSGGHFWMGHSDHSANPFFKGQMDEWGFWNKALSQSEINDLDNSGSGQTMTTSCGGATISPAMSFLWIN